MNDITPIEDLRPAPRTTPTAVLYAMFAVVFIGMALLIWPRAPERAKSGPPSRAMMASLSNLERPASNAASVPGQGAAFAGVAP